MKILSLYLNMPSSVALYIDGHIVAATHEERFTRQKNDEIFPESAIQYCLDSAGISSSDLDAVAIASEIAPFDDLVVRRSQWTVEDYLKEQHLRWKPTLISKDNQPPSLIELFREKLSLDMYPGEYWKKHIDDPRRNLNYAKDREEIVSNFLEIPTSKVKRIDHHRCHAAYSYYCSHMRGEKVLAFTIDGMGDGLNATIGIFDERGKYKRVYAANDANIGRVYRYMTLMLGMKPNEHEFKVMGLAPYGKIRHAQKALDLFKSTLYVEGIEFKWRTNPTDSYFWFKDRLEGVRFDNVAFALQMWVEDLLVEWVKNAIKKFGIRKVVIAGGVAMNIKAMGKIAALNEVEDLFIGGSAGDESMAISSGICLAEDIAEERGKIWDSEFIPPLPNLYLGPMATFEQESEIISTLDSAKYLILDSPTSQKIAELLASGKILARCAGRMEFGQRSLGNRSILADPSDLRVKERINAAIKNRDFWMPFAPVILESYVSRYLINPKNLVSPYMTISFDTTSEGYDAMIAACHPADKTARAQILEREANPDLYDILEAFELLTGRGALLNTSFNLHGSPIVNSPSDAIYVLDNSGLDGLIFNNFLIQKIG